MNEFSGSTITQNSINLNFDLSIKFLKPSVECQIESNCTESTTNSTNSLRTSEVFTPPRHIINIDLKNLNKDGLGNNKPSLWQSNTKTLNGFLPSKK